MSAAKEVVQARAVTDLQVEGAGSVLEIIRHAATDKNVDIDKMERLMAMYERMQARSAQAAYAQALSIMQPELPAIVERGGIRDRAGNIQSTYALWEDINKAIKPILAKHGFALSFKTGNRGDKILVTGVLSHRDGHSESTEMELPSDTSGSKNAVQAVASSISYGQRYTARALLNLTSVGSDNDGGGPELEKLDENQAANLRALLTEVRANEAKFCAYMRVAKIEDILKRDYQIAITALESKR